MNNYIMIGVGGTGTHLLTPLTTYLRATHAEDDWMLYLIDGDVVEEKNLARQVFAPGHITMNKADAAAMSMSDEQHVQSTPMYLSEENIDRFIRDGDTVFICADNFTVRKKIEDHVLTLDNAVVINGGNEEHSGSVQLWVRKHGKDVTPRIGYLHPEVAIAIGEDRAEMTCAQAAALPGGAQTIIANLTSATWMLTALWRYHQDYHENYDEPGPSSWTEVQFDALDGTVEHLDQRVSHYWNT